MRPDGIRWEAAGANKRSGGRNRSCFARKGGVSVGSVQAPAKDEVRSSAGRAGRSSLDTRVRRPERAPASRRFETSASGRKRKSGAAPTLCPPERRYLPTMPVKISRPLSGLSRSNLATIEPPPRRPSKLPVPLTTSHAAPWTRLGACGRFHPRGCARVDSAQRRFRPRHAHGRSLGALAGDVVDGGRRHAGRPSARTSRCTSETAWTLPLSAQRSDLDRGGPFPPERKPLLCSSSP
jgi:hypothetical protein